MYGQMPYMFPGSMMQSAAPVANAFASPGGLGGALGAAKTGAGSLLGKVNWSSLLSNAQKTLNVVNQAIPLYYQVKPVFGNIKTLGRIGKEFNKMGGTTNQTANNTSQNSNIQPSNENVVTENNSQEEQTVPEPKFFL